MGLRHLLSGIAVEPPFRSFVREFLKRWPTSAETRARWDISPRPVYLLGVLTGALQAKAQGIGEISVIEFGVAGGAGLVALQDEADAVEKATGVSIRVFGFDMGGSGLPDFTGDYRDHPEFWKPGDFPMDVEALRARLASRTTLVIGNVRETVPSFFTNFEAPPIGFASLDLDLYSSTRDALQIFIQPNTKMLWHVPVYFDDIDYMFSHRFAGELLAISQFNEFSEDVKIDRWYGAASGRPFPDRPYLQMLFVVHDLAGASKAVLQRDPVGGFC